ncbi:MAG: exodeoxyribonuclease VII small subunit [Bacilli bacterium]|nr:exodeoxyribonuclease VII small subunit [Bacilli bacterium]
MKDKEEVKFEENIKELETIINELENGNVDLEESIEKYTKAMKLVAVCDKKLKTIEKQISKIVTDNGIEDFKIEE